MNYAPTAVIVNPSSTTINAGSSIVLSATYKDPNGYSDIAFAGILINTKASASNCLLAYYNRATNKLFIYNDSGTGATGGYAPGSVNIIENSYARLDCSKTSVVKSGNNLVIRWCLVFKSSFPGAKNIYLWVKDIGKLHNGWVDKGNLTITASPPSVSSITLASTGNFHQGWPVTIKANASDPDGDTIQYRYLVGTTVIQDWTTASQISWSPATSNVGLMTIKVETKTQYETGGSSEKQAYIYRKPAGV